MPYEMKNLKGDLSGGLVAGVIALPLALAFGVQSGMGAAAGLYGAIAVGIFAAWLGGTPTQASGPTGPMTVVAASIVVYATARAGSVEEGLGIVLMSFFAGGLFQLGLGLLGIGKYVKYFPYPVVSGFMSGVGLIIVCLQLWPLLGSSSPKSTFEVVSRIQEPLSAINWSAVFLGGLTLAINYLVPLVTKAVPSVLVALIAGTGVAVTAGLGVPTVGDIPTGFPDLRVNVFMNIDPSDYAFIVESGLTLALLGSIDSLLTSVIADNITKTQHNSRRELIGQGIGNMIAACFGGIPGAGATKGTVVNINAGARTRLSGIVHGLLLLAMLLGAGAFVSYIPLSVLAGLLISVGVAIIDRKGLRHLLHVPRADALVMMVVLVWTVFGNLIYAVAAGVVLASVLFMKTASDLEEERSSVENIGRLPAEEPWPDESDLSQKHEGEVFVTHLHGPLFFGFTSGYRALASQLSSKTRVLIIRMERVPYMDQSGMYALEDTVLDLHAKGATVLLIGIQDQPLDMLRRIYLVPDLVPEDQLFYDMAACMAWLAKHYVAK
ncbi:MAG: SulP family inorganic anion transporter [Nitrospirota bacterium]